jgi:uncharacterized protein involved in exopolysaccharide biosynthesis
VSTTEPEETQHVTGTGSRSSKSQFSEYVIAKWIVTTIWRCRRFLVVVTGLGVLLAAGIGFLLPKEYKSTAQLMPPDQQSLSHASVLSSLTGNLAFSPGMAASFMNSSSPGATLIGILSSQTVQDDIINQLDLRRVYHCKLYVEARKTLTKRSSIEEDRKSGIVSITVMDHDPSRARAIAQAYIEVLDKLVNSLNDSAARRERIFLEGRLKTISSNLDASSRELSDFSSHNATLDIQKQGEATVEAAGRLQGELISAEAELSGLKTTYADENVRVREAEGRVEVLQRQLKEMSGAGGKAGSTDLRSDQLLPSVRELPVLGVTYNNLYRQVTMEESLYETLTKQYELAKVEEAKETPVVRVLDQPGLPERKSGPSEALIVLVGFLLSSVMGMAWIMLSALWEMTDDSIPVKADLRAMYLAIRGR